MTLAAALDRLDRYVHEVAREWAIPGLAVAVTDREVIPGQIAFVTSSRGGEPELLGRDRQVRTRALGLIAASAVGLDRTIDNL